MSKGLLGKAMSNGGNNVIVYKIASSAQFATVTVDIENPTAGDVTATVYFSPADTPVPLDRVGYGTIPAGGHMELNCKLMSADERVIVNMNAGNCPIRVTGLEEIQAQ